MVDSVWMIHFQILLSLKLLNLLKNWFNIHNEDVINFMELGDKVLVLHRSELLDPKTELYGNLETHNVSKIVKF
jgi:hypothetical protein